MADGLYNGVHVLNLDGRAASTYRTFTRMQREQLAITNLQQTGQTAGVVRDTFALDPVARRSLPPSTVTKLGQKPVRQL